MDILACRVYTYISFDCCECASSSEGGNEQTNRHQRVRADRAAGAARGLGLAGAGRSSTSTSSAAPAEAAAHLLEFDSVARPLAARRSAARATRSRSTGSAIGYSSDKDLGAVPVARGRRRHRARVLPASSAPSSSSQPYFDAGVKKVIVAAPVKGDALNVVMGVND